MGTRTERRKQVGIWHVVCKYCDFSGRTIASKLEHKQDFGCFVHVGFPMPLGANRDAMWELVRICCPCWICNPTSGRAHRLGHICEAVVSAVIGRRMQVASFSRKERPYLFKHIVRPPSDVLSRWIGLLTTSCKPWSQPATDRNLISLV